MRFSKLSDDEIKIILTFPFLIHLPETMKILNLTFLFFFISSLNAIFAQKFISHHQESSIGTKPPVVIKNNTRVLIIENGFFDIELPKRGRLTGSLTLESEEEINGFKKQVFKTDQDCILVIDENLIFLNLYRTDDMAHTFFLENYIEPSESGKIKKAKETEYKVNVEVYGKFTADCLKEGIIKPGMNGTAVLLVLGTPTDLIERKTKSGFSSHLVYENMDVFIENNIVSSIVKRKRIR